jgi:ribosomal protein S18 acetylase RimI-like enzyme
MALWFFRITTLNTITIKTATISDITFIKEIYDESRSIGRTSGSCDWSDDYPNDAIIANDIKNGYISIVLRNAEPIAVFSLVDHDDLDNEPINWKASKSGIPVRICIKSQYQGKGLGKIVMKELIKIAKEKGYQSLRLLASVNNLPANKLYRDSHFAYKGLVHLYQKEFNAFELLI